MFRSSTSSSRSLWLRLGLFLAMVGIGQYGAYQVIGNPSFKQIEGLRKALQKEAPYLYLGDSTVGYHSPGEADSRTLDQLLQKEMGVPVVAVAHPASHFLVYEGQVRYIANRATSPTTILLPINLRNFSPETDLRPGYQFLRRRTAMKVALYPWAEPFLLPLMVLRAFPEADSSNEAFFQTPIPYQGKVVGTVGEFERRIYGDQNREARQAKWIYYYGYDLQPDHRQLRALSRILQAAQTNANLKLALYLTPIDLHQATNDLGETLRQQVEKNVGTIQQTLAQAGVAAADFLDLIPSSQFAETEHLLAKGRLALAQALAHHLRDGEFRQLSTEEPDPK